MQWPLISHSHIHRKLRRNAGSASMGGPGVIFCIYLYTGYSFFCSCAASLTLLNIEAYYSVLCKDCPCPERKSQGPLCDLFPFLHHLHDLVSTYIFPILSSLMALDPLLFQSQGLCTYRSLLLKCFTCPLLNELFRSNLYKMLRREKESYH